MTWDLNPAKSQCFAMQIPWGSCQYSGALKMESISHLPKVCIPSQFIFLLRFLGLLWSTFACYQANVLAFKIVLVVAAEHQLKYLKPE